MADRTRGLELTAADERMLNSVDRELAKATSEVAAIVRAAPATRRRALSVSAAPIGVAEAAVSSTAVIGSILAALKSFCAAWPAARKLLVKIVSVLKKIPFGIGKKLAKPLEKLIKFFDALYKLCPLISVVPG